MSISSNACGIRFLHGSLDHYKQGISVHRSFRNFCQVTYGRSSVYLNGDSIAKIANIVMPAKPTQNR